jgi:hypothetical protein
MSSIVTEAPSASTHRTWRLAGRLAGFAAASLCLGAAAGVIWWLVVKPPAYELNSNGGATTTERGLSQFIAAAWFCIIGLVAGLLIGIAAWRWLRSLGWSVVLVVLACATAAALTCWLVGYRLGPGDFPARLAAAQPGDLVPIPLTLRARAALLTWPFFAIIPVLLGASLGRDDEEARPLLRRRVRSGDQAQ